MRDWHPRSWLALMLGVTVLLFVLGATVFKIIHPEIQGPTEAVKIVAEAWKEVMLSIVGGLMVWLGGKSEGH